MRRGGSLSAGSRRRAGAQLSGARLSEALDARRSRTLREYHVPGLFAMTRPAAPFERACRSCPPRAAAGAPGGRGAGAGAAGAPCPAANNSSRIMVTLCMFLEQSNESRKLIYRPADLVFGKWRFCDSIHIYIMPSNCSTKPQRRYFACSTAATTAAQLHAASHHRAAARLRLQAGRQRNEARGSTLLS